MEDFLKDPYEDTKRRYNVGNAYQNPEMDQFTNLDDLQFTVAPNASQSQNQGIFDQQYNGSHSTQAKDPFLETFDFLGSPLQQEVSPNLASGGNDNWAYSLGADNAYGDGGNVNSGIDPLNNIDSLMLPVNSNSNISHIHGTTGNSNSNNGVSEGHNILSSSQYFSPNSRGANFGQLNSIVEDSVSPSYYSNAFSPSHSRHGSVSIPPPSNSYLSQHLLSPQTHAGDASYDTLKSPYSGSYLNSPPVMSLSQSGNNLNPSFASMQANAHSPNMQAYGLGPSSVGAVPNTHLRTASDQAGSKQMTSEEKANRRREFHNAVERRRRDLIKKQIKVLGFLVPPSMLTPQVCAVQALSKQPHTDSKEMKELISSVRLKDSKPNKAFILQTSVDYIKHLQCVLEQQKAKREELEEAIADLKASPSPQVKSEPDVDAGVRVGDPTFSPSEFNPDEFFNL